MNTSYNLLIDQRSKKQMQNFINAPSHALLISAPAGSGKLSVAQKNAMELLGLESAERLYGYAHFTHIKRPEGKQDIPIDSVRELTRLLKLKVPGDRTVRRVIIVEDAQDLNEEAQNAMLKMLEEPAPDCVFILTSVSANNLLPTIVSRTQQLQVQPVTLKESLDYFKDDYNDKQIESAWNLSQGSPGLMSALLQDDQEHPLKLAINNAKQYLQKDKYNRLLQADSLSKDKKQLALFLEALLKLLAVLHHGVVKRENSAHQDRLLASRKLVHKLQTALDANASPKLIMLELALNLL